MASFTVVIPNAFNALIRRLFVIDDEIGEFSEMLIAFIVLDQPDSINSFLHDLTRTAYGRLSEIQKTFGLHSCVHWNYAHSSMQSLSTLQTSKAPDVVLPTSGA